MCESGAHEFSPPVVVRCEMKSGRDHSLFENAITVCRLCGMRASMGYQSDGSIHDKQEAMEC